MEAHAIIKNIGISTKKGRIPAMIVKGMGVSEALATLQFMRKGTAIHVAKAIKSAAQNAVNKGAEVNKLVVKNIFVEKGQGRIKHYHPKAKGAGYFMWQRGRSHIKVIVSDDASAPKKVKVSKVEKTVEKKEVKKAEKPVKTEKKVRKTAPKKAEK